MCVVFKVRVQLMLMMSFAHAQLASVQARLNKQSDLITQRMNLTPLGL
jgi:hypothetical protein